MATKAETVRAEMQHKGPQPKKAKNACTWSMPIEMAGLKSKSYVAAITSDVMGEKSQDKGYVESRTEPLPAGAIGLPRRWYRPTDYGLRVHEAWSMAARSFAAQTAATEIRSGAA